MQLFEYTQSNMAKAAVVQMLTMQHGNGGLVCRR